MQNFALLIIPFSKRHTYFKNVVLKVVNVCKMKELLTCQNQKKTLKKVCNKKNAALCFMLDGYNKKHGGLALLTLWPQFFIPPGKQFFRFCEKAVNFLMLMVQNTLMGGTWWREIVRHLERRRKE